jgi:hypothetical protein
MNLKYINPLPNDLEKVFSRIPPRFRGGNERRRPLRLRPVGGDPAGALLRRRIEGINKTDGLTWKVREVLDAVRERVASTAGKNGH